MAIRLQTYMTSLSSKEIAYSNFIQVIRSKTAMGFVPNYSAGGTKSIDRTEPPIGAKVMLEMYNKFKDEWIVEVRQFLEYTGFPQRACLVICHARVRVVAVRRSLGLECEWHNRLDPPW